VPKINIFEQKGEIKACSFAANSAFAFYTICFVFSNHYDSISSQTLCHWKFLLEKKLSFAKISSSNLILLKALESHFQMDQSATEK